MKTKHFHKRVFVFTYFDEDLPKFETQEEIDEWHRALGRMVAYGLNRDATEDTIEIVTAGLTTKPLEVCAGYHARLPVTDVKDADGNLCYYKGDGAKLDTVLDQLTIKARGQHRAFVMAAVKHSDGKFGFHS